LERSRRLTERFSFFAAAWAYYLKNAVKMEALMAKEQSQQEKKQGGGVAFPTLPKAMEHRLSLKWLTIEALRKLVKRFEIEGSKPRVMLLTAFGLLEGTLCELQSSCAESYMEEDGGALSPDLASMVTHIRTDMLAMLEKEEKDLKLVDAAPILSLCDVVLKTGGEEQRLPQLTLFADQVIGFSLTSVPKLHGIQHLSGQESDVIIKNV
jgi:hypothetical protein